jgi:hypothetical protein
MLTQGWVDDPPPQSRRALAAAQVERPDDLPKKEKKFRRPER